MKLDLIGQKSGRLTVIEKLAMTKSGALWRCVCDCGGGSVDLLTSALRKGFNGALIGCKACEPERRSLKTSLRTHGHCSLGKTKLYMVWKGMLSRCRDKGNTSWKWYGAIGVRVCEEWTKSYQAFYEWSLSTGYAEGLTIDRVDPCKDYSPSNCRWVSHQEQMKNLRVHHKSH